MSTKSLIIRRPRRARPIREQPRSHPGHLTRPIPWPLPDVHRRSGGSDPAETGWLESRVEDPRFTAAPLKGFSIGGGLRWTKHIRLHPNWDIALYEPGYTKVDLFARYTTKLFGKPVGIQINADNIFSEEYYDHVFIRAEPVTVSTTLRFQF
ncbi:MAG: hypothetical protein ACREH8_09640 [Opitutaceae bacterium]